MTHSPWHLAEPDGWILYLSHVPPTRLVVFVHGFRGKTLAAWRNFPSSGMYRSWWRSCDMLFVGYPSRIDTVAGTEYRLRRQLSKFYPRISDELVQINGVSPRSLTDRPYSELLLVGHSLGGLIIRRAISEVAQPWSDAAHVSSESQCPPILDSTIRLFSPAIAGFRASGRLGQFQTVPFLGLMLSLALVRSAAFNDLQPGSQILTDTRARQRSSHRSIATLRDCEPAFCGPTRKILLFRNTTRQITRLAP